MVGTILAHLVGPYRGSVVQFAEPQCVLFLHRRNTVFCFYEQVLFAQALCRSFDFHQVCILNGTHECYQCGHRHPPFGWWSDRVKLASLQASQPTHGGESARCKVAGLANSAPLTSTTTQCIEVRSVLRVRVTPRDIV